MSSNDKFHKKENNDYKLNRSSSEDKYCILKFSMCDDKKYPMHKLQERDLKEFVKFAKKVENLKWKEIRTDSGLKYESLDTVEKPDYISDEIILHSMRLSQKSRVLGYKQDEFFYIVWFDNNHKTC